MLAPLKRITPASAVRHGARILTIVAKASFWALCYHYFGVEALLYVAASWTFLLGVKDITFVRVRLSSLKDPAKRSGALTKSVAAELSLIAIRLAAIFLLARIVAQFNADVAALIPMMAVSAGFWARETIVTLSSVFGTHRMRLYISFAAAAAALGSIIYFAENGFDPIHSAIWSLLIREGLAFFGFAIIALLGCFGFRSDGEADDDDDEDGGDSLPILAPDGRQVRSTWKLLIADNVVYSRWRMMHFATRFVAHGILGPFGGIATRIAFSYRKPSPYKHHADRVSIGKIIALAIASAVMVSAIVYIGDQFGLLHAIGIVAAAFLFRVAALSINLLFWRQLSPSVGASKRSLAGGKGMAPPASSEKNQETAPGTPSARLGDTKMKVAIFVDNFSATGVVTNAIAIAGHLHGRGCAVQLIATQIEGALIGSIPEGIKVVGLLPEGNDRASRPDRLRRSVIAFRRCLREFSPDVLFSAGNHGHLASVLVSRALPGCRTIVRISNDLDHMMNGQPARSSSRWRRTAKFRVVAALADRLVFVSRHLLQSKAVLGSPAMGKAVVIPNGVDAGAVRRRAEEPVSHPWLEDGGEIPLVLAVGRLALQKNFANLLRALAIARKSRPLRLLIIGSGPLRAELMRDAEALGIAGAVEIMEPVSNPMPFLARASVVALPSWWEGSSNVLLEALACGTPVVASRTAGNAEDVLEAGRYGLLVDPGDAEAMAAALLVQTGGEARLPGDRAADFSREAALRAYGDLIMAEAAA